MSAHRSLPLILALAFALSGQEAVRPKDVRETAKAGSSAIPKLRQFLKNPDLEVRLEAVKEIIEIGSVQAALDPLIEATADNDPEMQVRATDGLVNFYLPGLRPHRVRRLPAARRRHHQGQIHRHQRPGDRPLRAGAAGRDCGAGQTGARRRQYGRARQRRARRWACCAEPPAVPDLIEALHSKDSGVIYESLVALQKIRDQSAAPKIAFLLRDFDQKVQIAAIETTGLLQNKEALPGLVDVLSRARDTKVRRAALTAIAMLPDEKNRALYSRYLRDKDDQLRAAAAEGYARLKNPADLPMLEKAWNDEGKTHARLSLAFAQVMLGKTGTAEFSPLQYLINTLNSSALPRRGVPVPGGTGARRRRYAPSSTGPCCRGPRTKKCGWRACWRAAATRMPFRTWRS